MEKEVVVLDAATSFLIYKIIRIYLLRDRRSHCADSNLKHKVRYATFSIQAKGICKFTKKSGIWAYLKIRVTPKSF